MTWTGRSHRVQPKHWPVFLVTWLPFGLGKLDCGENRKISRNVGDTFDPERAPQETESAYS